MGKRAVKIRTSPKIVPTESNLTPKKMYLKKLICINWGNLPNREYEFGSLTLLTGGSGAGKTTLADSIQTVMTAAKQGLYVYNPGQEETTQYKRRGKMPRTLPSYILGAEDQHYARPQGTHGYVALVFSPSADETADYQFSALMGVTASLSVETMAAGRKKRIPRTESVHLITVENQAICIEDLILEREDSRLKIVPPDEALNRLRRRYDETVIINDFNDNKKNYLNKLYGLLRGKSGVSAQESEQAARAFSKFMAYKPIEDINSFVRDEVLEKQDIRQALDNISSLMLDFNGLRKEAERLENNIVLLEQAKLEGEQVRQAWFTRREQQLLLVLIQAQVEQFRLEKAQQVHQELNTEDSEIQRRLTDIQQDSDNLEKERLSIERQRQQHQSAQEKDRLLSQIDDNLRHAAKLFQAIITGVEVAGKNSNYARQIGQTKTYLTENDNLKAAFKAANNAGKAILAFDMDTIVQISTEFRTTLQAEQALPQSLCQSLAEHLKGIDNAHETFQQAVAGDENGLRDMISRHLGQRHNEITELNNSLKELNRQIERLREHGEVTYPKAIKEALSALHQHYPEAHPQVLCDLVEVRDNQWQSAIEGYLGFNRYGILVEPEYEGRAIEMVRQLAKKGAQVIQGGKAVKDAARIGLAPESIVHELKVIHPTAKAYLQASYANVIKVAEVETLRTTPRGLTQQGHASSSYKLFICALGDHELVFGAEARQRRLSALEKRYALEEAKLNSGQQEIRDLEHLIQLVREVQTIQIEADANELVRLAKTIAHLEEQIKRLDLSDIKDLDNQVKRIQAQLNQLQKERDTKNKRSGKIDNEKSTQLNLIQKTEVALTRLNADIEQHKNEVIKLQRLAAEYEAEAVIERLTQEAKSPLAQEANITDKIDKAQRTLLTAKDKFQNRLSEYNQKAKPVERITLELERMVYIPSRSDDFNVFDAVMAGYIQVKTQLRNQKEIGLANQKRQLSDANHSVQKAFTGDFCNTVISALESGRSRLESLNRELQGHRFGEEQYRFGWEWVPEYKRYYNFFQAVIEMDSPDDDEELFGSNTTLSEDHQAVRDEITTLLLHEHEDTDKANRRLEEISDYRNYRRYDIYKDTQRGIHPDTNEPIMASVPLSEYGTGSGGQLETPAYVIRAAAISSAFRLNEGDYHLRMALIDESFKLMDETRAKSILNYLTKTLKFQIIFVMPTKAAGPFQPMLTNKWVFSKVASANAPGEMSTIVQVQDQRLNQESVEKLWQERREEVKQEIRVQFAA